LTQTYQAQTSITVITKYTAAGAIVWQKSFSGRDAMSLAIDSSDRAYITVGGGDPIIGVYKFETTGGVLWQREYDIGPVGVWDALIEEKSATTLALVCSGSFQAPGSNMIIAMEISASTGAVEIKRRIAFDALDDFVYVTGLDVDPDENVFITGSYFNNNDGIYNMFIEKLDQNLGRVWSKAIDVGSTYNMKGGDCASDALGNIYAVGAYQVNTMNSNPDNDDDKSAGILTKLNSSGVIQWTRRLGPGPCGSFIAGLTATATGDVYLSAATFAISNDSQIVEAGQSAQEDYGDNKMIVVRYTTSGDVVWQRYVDVAHLSEVPHDLEDGDSRGQAIAVFEDKFAVDGFGRTWNTAPNDEFSSYDNEDDYFVVQLPTAGTDLNIGDLHFTASRVPARFINPETITTPLVNIAYPETILAEDVTVNADAVARVANAVVNSDTYDYTFGADGTLTIPNDGDLRLTQSQKGYMMSIGGPVNNTESVYYGVSAVDSQGNMYVGGEEDDSYDGFITKISPTGERLWSVRIIEDDEGYDNGVRGIAINPETNAVTAVCSVNGGDWYGVVITLDQDTGRIIDNTEYKDSGSDIYLNGITFDSNNEPILIGEKDSEFVAPITVTKQTGSATGLIKILRSAIPGIFPSGWQIGGTGITGYENVAYVERYTGLTGTVRQGSGAVFTIDKTEASAGTTYTSSSFGTGLSVVGQPGVATITATKANWTSGTDYDTFEALSNTTVFTVSTGGGPQTFTANNKSVETGVTVTWTGVWASGTEGLNEVPVSVNFGSTTGSYSVQVTNGGTNYLPGHKIKILGTNLGGTTPTNDCTITVQGLTSGAISSVSNTGTPTGAANQYTGRTGTNTDVGSGFTLTLHGPFIENNYDFYDNSRTITDGGTNYVDGDVIVIPGTSLGGASTVNDLTAIVTATDGVADGFSGFTGTAQSTTWKLNTTTQVDFSGSGSWSIQYPLSQESLLITDGWSRTFGTNGNLYDYLSAVARDTSNNIIAVGRGNGKLDVGIDDLAIVYKFTSTGTLDWTRKLNDEADDCTAKSVTTIGTDIYVTHTNDSSEIIISKLDTNGNVKWQRITGASGNYNSSIAATADGNLLVVADGYQEDINEDAVKVFLLSPAGEVIYKRWLMATTDDSTWVGQGRCLSVVGDSFYVSCVGSTEGGAWGYDSVFVAQLPVDGSGTGEYGSFRYVDVNAEAGDINYNNAQDNTNYIISELDLAGEFNFAGPLDGSETPYINSTDTYTIGTGEFIVDSFYLDVVVETVRDTDGGSIIFPDGTKQTTSATEWPQTRFFGQKYTVGMKDRGGHILCTEFGDSILLPYNSRVELPIGTVVRVVNITGEFIGIQVEGGGTSMIVAGVGTSSYADLEPYGMATVLKIERDRWHVSGDVGTGP
jgi:hypothetical protein